VYTCVKMKQNKIKAYYKLTKPGIIRGNLMTAAAGFFLASKGYFDWALLLALLGGIALIIGSACVFNNYIDRDIDKKMKRTKDRALVTGEISVNSAINYAILLGVLGFWLLAEYTNALTVGIGLIGIFSYVVLYGYYKRRSVHGTLVGSISGATSLVAGYCAVSGRFDKLALLLFIVMAIWQMPHFYAIGTYRQKDYAKAGLPILPVVKGIPAAKKYILGYITLYAISVSLLSVLGYTGYTYRLVMLVVCILWLRLAVKGFSSKDDIKYGHQIFGFSLLTLLIFSLMISIDHFLP